VQSEALAQAGYKLATVTTFGQPLFRAPTMLPSSAVQPLRVVSRTDPVWRLFSCPSRVYHHHGPELVLLPDLAFHYAPQASSPPLSPSSPPALPSSPLSRRAAAAAPAKGKEKSARRDSDLGSSGKRDKEDKKKKNSRDRSPSPDKKSAIPSPSSSGSSSAMVEALAGEAADDVENSAEHRMESYLRNLKAKIRGTPHRASVIDSP
jgi:hypothetical protein